MPDDASSQAPSGLAAAGASRPVDFLHPLFAVAIFSWTSISPSLRFPDGAVLGWLAYVLLLALLVGVPRVAGARLTGRSGHVLLAAVIAFLLLGAHRPFDPALTAVAALILVIVYGPARGRPGFAPADVLYRFSPVILASFIYVNLKHMSLPSVPVDDALIALDRQLFGADLTVVAEHLYHPVLSEWLAFHYSIYLTFPALTPLLLYRPYRFARFEEYVFCFALAMYIGFFGYLGVPGSGPNDGLAAVYSQREVPGMWLTSMQWPVINRYRFPFDAFPSMHTANSLLCTWVLFRAKSPVAWLFVFLVVNLLCSLVYLRMHYTIDIAAGMALALAVALIGPRLSGARR